MKLHIFLVNKLQQSDLKVYRIQMVVLKRVSVSILPYITRLYANFIPEIQLDGKRSLQVLSGLPKGSFGSS